jgi:hypothetical protein
MRHIGIAQRCNVCPTKRVHQLRPPPRIIRFVNGRDFSFFWFTCLFARGVTLPFHFKYTTMTTTESWRLGVHRSFPSSFFDCFNFLSGVELWSNRFSSREMGITCMGYGQNHYITSTGWDWGLRVTMSSEHRDIGVFLFLIQLEEVSGAPHLFFPAALCFLNGSNGDGSFFTTIPFRLPFV